MQYSYRLLQVLLIACTLSCSCQDRTRSPGMEDTSPDSPESDGGFPGDSAAGTTTVAPASPAHPPLEQSSSPQNSRRERVS